ncbi:hypothetical protein [Streptomyces sp. NBC_01506]|uniref:hypothetical protein n=1 Tax=Streptomyces sp. NBC_01506 TaxID=2903887 RepID=UPI0038647158
MTMLGSGTTLGLKPLCWALKPRTQIRCVRIGPDHDGDHTNTYRDGGVSWPQVSGEKR